MHASAPMTIDSPGDYDFQLTSTHFKKLKSNSLQSSGHDSTHDTKQSKKKKKNKMNIEKEELSTVLKKKSNYFHKLYKETQKNLYINIFIRKLKQLIVRSENFTHQLIEEEGKVDFINSIETIQLNKYLEAAFSVLFIILTVFSCAQSTLALVFFQVQASTFEITISSLTFVFVLTELVLNILTRSSINVNDDKENHHKLAKDALLYYFHSGWLVIDLLIIVIFFINIFLPLEQLDYFKLIILVKLIQMIGKIRNLQILFITNSFREQFWELIKIFLFNFFFAHIVAILLIYMAKPSSSWLTIKNIEHSPWNVQYIWSYYWAITIMYSVGFGDLTPTNIEQATVMIFIESLSCIVLGYNITTIGKIVNKITSYEMQKIQNLKIFTQMEAKEPISEDTRKKIVNYLIQSSQLKRNFNVNQQKQLLNKLPKTFYEQFKKQSTLRIFNTIPFFRNLKSSKLQELAIKIEKKLTHPEEIIVQSGQVPQIYIANSGHISYNMNRVGLKSHGKEVKSYSIKENEYRILSLYFFIRKPLNYDVKCKDYTILYSISKKQLENLLSTNPYCYEYYCMYRDKDRFNSSDWQTEVCELCGNNIRHTYFECPKLHYVAIKNMVVGRALNSNNLKYKIQISKRRRRLWRKSVSALKYYSQIENVFKEIRIQEKVKEFMKQGGKKAARYGKTYTIDVSAHYHPQELQAINEELECDSHNGYSTEAQSDQYIKFKTFSPSHNLNSMKKLKKQFQLREHEEKLEESLYQAECCHKTSLQIQTLMKIQYLKQFAKQSNKIVSFTDVCKELTQRLKQEFLHSPLNTIEIRWELELDAAYDFSFYFQNDNPTFVRKKWKKKIEKKKQKLMY